MTGRGGNKALEKRRFWSTKGGSWEEEGFGLDRLGGWGSNFMICFLIQGFCFQNIRGKRPTIVNETKMFESEISFSRRSKWRLPVTTLLKGALRKGQTSCRNFSHRGDKHLLLLLEVEASGDLRHHACAADPCEAI